MRYTAILVLVLGAMAGRPAGAAPAGVPELRYHVQPGQLFACEFTLHTKTVVLTTSGAPGKTGTKENARVLRVVAVPVQSRDGGDCDVVERLQGVSAGAALLAFAVGPGGAGEATPIGIDGRPVKAAPPGPGIAGFPPLPGRTARPGDTWEETDELGLPFRFPRGTLVKGTSRFVKLEKVGGENCARIETTLDVSTPDPQAAAEPGKGDGTRTLWCSLRTGLPVRMEARLHYMGDRGGGGALLLVDTTTTVKAQAQAPTAEDRKFAALAPQLLNGFLEATGRKPLATLTSAAPGATPAGRDAAAGSAPAGPQAPGTGAGAGAGQPVAAPAGPAPAAVPAGPRPLPSVRLVEPHVRQICADVVSIDIRPQNCQPTTARLMVDGQSVAFVGLPPLYHRIPTAGLAAGEHVLRVEIYDAHRTPLAACERVFLVQR